MHRFLLALAASLVCGIPTLAQSGPIPGYRPADSARAALLGLAQGRPDVQVRSLGSTAEGRSIDVLRLGGAAAPSAGAFGPGATPPEAAHPETEGPAATAAAEARPAIAVVGGVFAPQISSSELVQRMAEKLASRIASDSAVAALVSDLTFYFMPRPSPDAVERFFDPLSTGHAGNGRPTDDDRDGESGEDPFEDLDGDGAITWMRVEDSSGPWRCHPEDPRVLIEADKSKGERGQYRLYSEGVDNDKDGAFNEDGPGGVDFNRNFTFRYPFFQEGAGSHQVSEPESRAVADFLFSKPEIGLVLSLTPEDNLLHPWKADRRAERERTLGVILGDDAEVLGPVAAEYKRRFPVDKAPAPAGGAGSFSEWAYFHYGRWSLAARGYWIRDYKPDSGEVAIKDGPGADDRRLLRHFDRSGLPGFAPWTAIEHPDFPGQKVEVGGIRPYFVLNPPADSLDSLAEKHLDFLLWLVEQRPRLRLESKAEALGGGLYKISVGAINDGRWPTMPAIGARTEQGFPLMLEVKIDGECQILVGRPRSEIPRLAPLGGRHDTEWILKLKPNAAARLSVRVSAPAVGAAETTLEIGSQE